MSAQWFSKNWAAIAGVIAALMAIGSARGDLNTAKADILRLDTQGTQYGRTSEKGLLDRLGKIEGDTGAMRAQLNRIEAALLRSHGTDMEASPARAVDATP